MIGSTNVLTVLTVGAGLPALTAAYSKLQYVGFPVQTGYNGYLGRNKLFYSNENGLGEYVGLEESKADIAARLKLYEKAAHAAIPHVDPSADTLKIFMAPEFFMRGPTGAYDVDDPAFLAIGDAFSKIVSDPKFEDWVFVSGSIIGSTLNEQSGLYDTYNMAIVQRGGDNQERVSHFKKYISSIDFLSAQPNEENAVVYPNMNLGVPLTEPTTMDAVVKQYSHFSPDKADQMNGAFGVNQGNSSFQMAGVTFCLDICLDHGYGVCAQELDKEKADGVSSGLVQAHLVIAAGSSIIPSNVRVPDGGSALLCDGLSNGAQHAVMESALELLENKVHKADPKRETPGLDAILVGHDVKVFNQEYEGFQNFTQVDFLNAKSALWKAQVNSLYAVQKYKGDVVEACVEARDDVAKMECYAENETKPTAFVFEPAPVVPLPEF